MPRKKTIRKKSIRTYPHRLCEPPQEAWQSSFFRGSMSGLLRCARNCRGLCVSPEHKKNQLGRQRGVFGPVPCVYPSLGCCRQWPVFQGGFFQRHLIVAQPCGQIRGVFVVGLYAQQLLAQGDFPRIQPAAVQAKGYGQ